VPDATDPSFAREERRANARRAAAEASPHRQQELRAKYAPPPAPARQVRPAGRKAAARDAVTFDVAAIAASARAALDAHPSTWTSFAELCPANGLDRSLAAALARQLGPASTGEHWFRIRGGDGVYDGVRDGSPGGARYGRDEADRALEAIGVRVRAHHADPERKLLWMHGEWCLAGR